MNYKISIKTLFLIGIPIFTVMVSCIKDSPVQVVPFVSTPVQTPPAGNATDTTTKTYLALGDSYTIGQSVHPQARFPAQTAALLRKEGFVIAAPVYIAATGWTTLNLAGAITTASLKPPYDLVSLLIGVNDQYQSRDTANYRSRFTSLLNKSIELSGNRPARVFVLSIPDYSATPFVAEAYKKQVSKEIDWFNTINRDVCLQRNISYSDITPSTRQALTDPSLVATDGLHPSGLEYLKWAALLAPKMKAALQ